MKEKAFIGGYGVFTTIVVTVLSVGIFSYPREITSVVNTDGWIVTLIAGIIALLILYIMYKTIKLNKYEEFNTILKNNFGKFFGKIVASIFVIYNVLYLSISMRIFVEVLKMYLLQKTPTEFIIISMIFVGTYLIRDGIRSIIKFNEIGFWITTIPIIGIMLFPLGNASTDFTNILPMLRNTPIKYLKGVGVSLFFFNGIQIIYMVLPYIKNKKSVKGLLLKSILFITLFYVIVTVFSLSIFSKSQTKTLLWPTITMIKSIDIPGAFVERWEGIVMIFWILFYFTSFINLYYFSSYIFKDIFNLEDVRISSLVIMPFIYVIALYAGNISEVYDMRNKVLGIMSFVVVIIIPLVLLFISKRKNKGVTKDET